MNVGQLVDQLMGNEADFSGEVVDAEAPAIVLLSDGTIISLKSLEYEPGENGSGGTLWIKGDYA